MPAVRALMQTAIALAAVASAAGVASAANIEADKRKHFFVSAALGAAGAATARQHGAERCEAARSGIVFTLVIGAGKEYYDLRIKRTHWSWGDLFWDLAGGTVGSLLVSGCH